MTRIAVGSAAARTRRPFRAGDSVPLTGAAAPAAGTAGAADADAIRAAPTGFAALCGCFSIAFYRPLFDVTTATVAARAKVALAPFTAPSFLDTVGDAPDLYVPRWGGITLVFLIGAGANFSSWASASGDADSIWHYDFGLVTAAAGFIFGFLALAAAGAWATLRYLGVPFALTKLLCLFGYAVLPFLPAAILCALPFSWLQWLAVSAAAGTSAHFLLRAAVPTFRALLAARYEAPTAGSLATYFGAAFALLMLGFGATMKFYFFSHMAAGDSSA